MSSLDQPNATCREYKLTNGRRLTFSVYAAMCLIGAGFFFKLAINPIGREFALVVGAVFLTPGIILLLQAWRSRLILSGETVELQSAFRTHRANRDEIEGLRTVENQYGQWTRICLKHQTGAFNVSTSFTGNDDLREWFKGLPDLDVRDADEIRQKVSSQESPGSSDNDGSNILAQAKTWAIGLSILAGLVSIPVMFVNYQPVYRAALVTLLACPLVGITLLHCFPLRFTALKQKADPRADLGFLIMWPGIAVMFSYQNSNDPTHLVDSFQLIYWSLLICIGYVAALFQIAWRSPSRIAVFFFFALTGFMYGSGLANAANALPDKSTPLVYQSWIVKKYESHSSKGTRYYLGVAPWGPILYRDDVDVPMSHYKAVNVGDPVCFGLHPGFLRAPWYAVMLCTTRPTTTAP